MNELVDWQAKTNLNVMQLFGGQRGMTKMAYNLSRRSSQSLDVWEIHYPIFDDELEDKTEVDF